MQACRKHNNSASPGGIAILPRTHCSSCSKPAATRAFVIVHGIDATFIVLGSRPASTILMIALDDETPVSKSEKWLRNALRADLFKTSPAVAPANRLQGSVPAVAPANLKASEGL